MTLPPCFPDPLQVRYVATMGDSRVFQLSHYFRYISSWGIITVPTGFQTDGASVPRIFWSIFQPYGKYFPAAIIHDYLYSRYSNRLSIDRKTADLIFKEAMFNLGIGWVTRETIYRAVRLGGGIPWKREKS
jgi:hypothetical protein